MLLFDLEADPHEQHDLADAHPDVVAHALALLGEWGTDALQRSATGIDPLWLVLNEGGPWHARVDLDWYLRPPAGDRPRALGRRLREDGHRTPDHLRPVLPQPLDP